MSCTLISPFCLTSRTSPKTLLTFCTNGVLLRTLMGGDHSLDTVTHVIIVSKLFVCWKLINDTAGMLNTSLVLARRIYAVSWNYSKYQ